MIWDELSGSHLHQNPTSVGCIFIYTYYESVYIPAIAVAYYTKRMFPILSLPLNIEFKGKYL